MIDNSLFNKKKVVFHTLGCKLNFAETSAIGKQLKEYGFVKTLPGEQADVCIINTCSVTDTADRKSRQSINRLHRLHPNAVVIVTGCYAQLKPEEVLKVKGVNLVLGANEKFDVPEFLEKYLSSGDSLIGRTEIKKVKDFKPSCSKDDRTRSFLKVQDGCDYYCTYCTIPFARGRSRNATIEETVKTAEEAIADGAKEIVLTGINIGDFGKSTKESFFDLVKALDNIDKDVRFRISSIEPNLLTDEIIRFVAGSNHFMPHFHIPLQSGTDEVLKIMKRKYDRELFQHRTEFIRSVLPDAFIGVDVITGVRGETDELFQDSYNFINSLDISQLHVFTYSERSGTKMLEIDYSVPIQERKRRSDLLHGLSNKKTYSFYESQIGNTKQVLWESTRHGDNMFGFTENYIKLERPFDRKLINTIETVTLGDWNEDKSALKAIY